MECDKVDEMQGVAISGYEIESAISTTAEAAKGADGVTLLILQNHLKKLCGLQLKQLSPNQDVHGESVINIFVKDLQADLVE